MTENRNNMKTDNEKILQKFEEVESRLKRAKLNYEVNLVRPETVKVSVYEVMKAINILTEMVIEINPTPTEIISVPDKTIK